MPEEQKSNQEQPIKERPSKGARALRQQEFHSYSSYWPIALAFALIIVLIGVIVHPIVIGIGVVLAAVAIIGWGLEKR